MDVLKNGACFSHGNRGILPLNIGSLPIFFAANSKSGSSKDTYVKRGGCIDKRQGVVVELVSS